jgi:general secretion pathway protein F
MVRAGEKGGVLEVSLRRLAEFLEARAQFSEAVVTALAYPLVITFVGAGAIVFLLTFVIPRFASIFNDLGQTIPLPTQILLTVSSGLREWWWLIAVVVLAVVLLWRLWTSSAEGRMAWDQLRLRLPLFGVVTRKIETARFARTLGTMLKSGVAMLGALGVVGDMMSNQAFGVAVTRLSDAVKRGGTVASAMDQLALFPPLAVHMVRVGEETGRLEDMLIKVASDFESEVRRLVKRLMGLLEPAIILIMGLIVGFIVVALLMAIFSLTEVAL